MISNQCLKHHLERVFPNGFRYLVLDSPVMPEGPEDLVVTSDGIISILYSQYRADQAYRLWALSHPFADLIEDILQLNPGTVGVIDRYELYPQKDSRDLRDSDSFVYAGRWDTEKNVHFLYDVFKEMKKLPEFKNHELYFCGQGAPDSSLGIHHLGDLGTSWTEHPGLNRSVFLTLSTYRYEDFSVSAAQSQAAGFPVICPAWGGFKDVAGAYMFNPEFLRKNNPAPDIVHHLSKNTNPARPKRVAESLHGRELSQRIKQVSAARRNQVTAFFLPANFPAEHSFFLSIVKFLS